MAISGRKIRKAVFVVTYVFLLFYFLWDSFLSSLANEYQPMGPIYTDVAKRILSPVGGKEALLIRRNAFDLNYAVKIKQGIKTRTLFWTRDFVPDMAVDWNEKIIWSDDSSFIVLTLDKPAYDRYIRYGVTDTQGHITREPNIKFMCAYDFKDGKKYNFNEKDKIISIMNSRCKEPKLGKATDWE
jgi:hypothetical protein